MSSASTSSSASTDWWCGGSGQVKWLTDVVAGGKSNDWLMQWYSNVLCLALALALFIALALALALVLVLALALALEIQATWRNFRYLIFMTYLYRAGGPMAPLAHPMDPLLPPLKLREGNVFSCMSVILSIGGSPHVTTTIDALGISLYRDSPAQPSSSSWHEIWDPASDIW